MDQIRREAVRLMSSESSAAVYFLFEYRFALPIEKEIKGWRYLIYAKRI